MIKKGCSIAAAVLLAVFGLYFWLLYDKVELGAAAVLSVLGAVGLLMLVVQLKAVISGSPEAEVLKRAGQGLPLEDGREEAVWGPIQPLGTPLEAPFSGRACVAYEYDAKKPDAVSSRGRRSSTGSLMTGFALAPSFIRSGRGDVHLFGFSPIDGFEEKRLEGPEALARASAWYSTTEFREMGVAKIGAMLSTFDEVMADDDGSVRVDMRMGDAASADDLAPCTLKEKVILPGETVTAIGLWDASRGGLVPKHMGKQVIVRLKPGGGEAMVAEAQKRPWGLLVFALVWAGGIHAVIFAVLAGSPR